MAKLSSSHPRCSDRPTTAERHQQLFSQARLGVLVLLAAFVLAARPPSLTAGGTGPAPPVTEAPMDAGAAVAEMERIYAEILNRFDDDTRFIAKLQASQKAWQHYRDAHLEALYPADDKMLAYGSAYRHCRQIAIAALTRERIKHLRQWLQGVPEGEVCVGSLPHASQ
jgi:uncharacterized protein YecT (DUF1311 family)